MQAPAPVAAVPAPAPAPAPVVAAAPVVAPAPVAAPAPAPEAADAFFELPTAQLTAVAESFGMQWVNSDPEKIRAAQAAIAAEGKPVHVPREIVAVAAVDEGPLVLVETRKDLSQVKLPFESA